MAHSWRDADVVERLDAHTISWVGENQCDAGLNGVEPLNWGLSWLFPNGHDVAIMQVSGRNLTIKNSLLSKQAAMTNRCIYIHQLLVSGWPTLCLQSYLNVSWHRFDKVLEPHLRDSSPCRHPKDALLDWGLVWDHVPETIKSRKPAKKIFPTLLHHQQPETSIQGRMVPCLHVAYSKLWHHSRNWNSSDQAAFVQSSVEPAWTVASGSCFQLTEISPGVLC